MGEGLRCGCEAADAPPPGVLVPFFFFSAFEGGFDGVCAGVAGAVTDAAGWLMGRLARDGGWG